MNPTLFTIEEESFICIFDKAERGSLISNIQGALSGFDDKELRGIAESVLRKLDALTDEEFSAYVLTFHPAYYDDD